MRNHLDRLIACASLLVTACAPSAAIPPQPTVSSTIALSSDGRQLWVVDQDADAISLIDPASRNLLAEIPLGPAPVQDPVTHRYEPKVKPRALTILPGDKKIYIAGQTADEVLVLDTGTRMVTTTIPVADEPTAVVAAPDGRAVYAVSHEGAVVSKIDPATDRVVATLPVGEHPWGASVSADGKTLYVSQFLLSPGLTTIDTATFKVQSVLVLKDQPPGSDKRIANGQPRGVYQAAPRPVGGEVWLPHLLLATQTAEPDLDFQSTVFPTISTALPDGSAEGPRLLFKPIDPPGATGAFTDVVSGPHAVAFTPDGKLALVADAQSEDVLVLDGPTGNEQELVRPIPSTFLEGIVIDRTGRHAYVEGRNSHDVTVLDINPSDPITPVTVDGAPIERLTQDPMPAHLRLGQRLFYTANSAVFPVTRNFWVACSTCHLEGLTDAVTWRFFVGPRDTPSNAGGPINTGFLLRQALRSSVTQYDRTIDVEQGGTFHRDDPAQQPWLQAIADFANEAIPFPQNPNLAKDGTLTPAQARGQTLFAARCASCHTGAYLTDSGTGNPTLDPNGPILLHDIGTCVKNGPFDDQPAPDEMGAGLMHTACDFDTPTLRGIFDSAPYFHDGSAATLLDVVNRLPFSTDLPMQDKEDLVAYLLTL